MNRRDLALLIGLALTPLVIALLWGALAVAGFLPNPGLYMRGEASAFAFVAGVGLSLWLVSLVWLAWVGARRAHRAEAAAHKAGAADRRRFLERLDHELKNPLTAIRAGLANLPEPAQGPALVSVESQVRRISRLTTDLRKLAELESRPLEFGAVQIDELLETVVGAVRERPEFAERTVVVSVPQAPWPVPAVHGDFDLLLLATLNLLDNALKFTAPGARIEIRAREDGGAVIIEVADTGPGIPVDEQPHLWEELYRGAGARSIPGSGLGLALCRAIVDRHGGKLSVLSQVGKGTVFTLRLPATASP
ncbi:MAG: HAMP domain-containing histidine kinase [Anaerolineales bacterium]|nr:HAMP domain-containing histidine kinase [Anaerolineales bacterium]